MNDNETTVGELRTLFAAFVAERNWEQFHDPKNLASSIAIETAELMEHFQWVRSDQLDQVRNDPEQMAAVREELADIMAFVLAFANSMNIDIAAAVADKMVKNARKYPADRYYGRFKA
jgi:NTP pyrophosphatase (non-canonical NTP hydrolase)